MNVCMVTNFPIQMAALAYACIKLRDAPIQSHSGWITITSGGTFYRGVQTSRNQAGNGAHIDTSYSATLENNLECSVNTSPARFEKAGFKIGGAFSLSVGKRR